MRFLQGVQDMYIYCTISPKSVFLSNMFVFKTEGLQAILTSGTATGCPQSSNKRFIICGTIRLCCHFQEDKNYVDMKDNDWPGPKKCFYIIQYMQNVDTV